MVPLTVSVTLRGVTPHTPPQGEVPFTLGSMAPPTPRRRTTLVVVAAAVGVLALMAATGIAVWFVSRPSSAPAAAPTPAPPAPANSREAIGTVVLQYSQFSWNGLADHTCQGWKGFSDIAGGAQVTVTDANGKALAIGALDRGTATGITSSDVNGLPRAERCTLPFKVSGIAPGVGPYGVQIAHRDIVRFEESRLGIISLGFGA